MLTDPISDMLTRIRNAVMARHERVTIPASKLKKSLAEILVSEGYVSSVQADTADNGHEHIVLVLKYGRDKHPAWYHNAVAHPDVVTLNGNRFRATEVTDAADYERLFALAVRVYPGYADYRARTDAIGRRIPLLRLAPLD